MNAPAVSPDPPVDVTAVDPTPEVEAVETLDGVDPVACPPTDAPPEAPVVLEPEPRDPLEYLSASRLNTWLGCRLKFFFRYVAGIRKPLTPALHIGKTVHATLQRWNLARWHGDDLDPNKLWSRFCQDWDEDQAGHDIDWGDDEPETKEHTWKLLEAYFEQTPVPVDERPEGVEVRAEVELSHHGLPTLIGVIDLVREGGVIVDFKTASSTPAPEQAAQTNEIQLSCYALLYRGATGERETGFELHHLVKNRTPKIVVTSLDAMTARQELRLLRVMESYVRGIEDEDYVPSPGMQCSYCQYLNECRKWC